MNEKESPREEVRPQKKAPHYPFTDENGATWHSFDYAEKGGRWYRKEIVETRFGCDTVMRPCGNPAIETRQESENRVAEDKELGIYQEAAQKFFDMAKHISTKLDAKSEIAQIPPPDPRPAQVTTEVPW